MNQYWATFFLIWTAGIFVGGYEVRGWRDTAELEKATSQHLENVEQAQTKIVSFNQSVEKVKANVKDNCVSQPIPPDLIKLLK